MPTTLTFKVANFEPPPASVGKPRDPNPYDAIVQKSWDERKGNAEGVVKGKAFFASLPHEPTANVQEEIGAQVKSLRNAAKFVGCSVAIRVIEGERDEDRQLWFRTVPLRKRESKATTNGTDPSGDA
ncbi:MAG: hypothetical protein ACREHG_04225 [Candidatus Saccharimonadales bacterium]